MSNHNAYQSFQYSLPPSSMTSPPLAFPQQQPPQYYMPMQRSAGTAYSQALSATAQHAAYTSDQQQQQQQQQQHGQYSQITDHGLALQRLEALKAQMREGCGSFKGTPIFAQQLHTPIHARMPSQPIPNSRLASCQSLISKDGASAVTTAAVGGATRTTTGSAVGMNTEEKRRQVIANNNRQLKELQKLLQLRESFPRACQQLVEWCKDERAYHPETDDALFACLQYIHYYGPRYNFIEAARVFQVVSQFLDRFSREQAAKLSEQTRAWTLAVAQHNKAVATGQRQLLSFAGPFHPSQNAINSSNIASVNGGQVPRALIQQIAQVQQHLASRQLQQQKQQQATSQLPARELSGPNAPVYCRFQTFLVRPFRLQHNKIVTEVPIFMGTDSFRRLWSPMKATSISPELPESDLPLTFQLTAVKIAQDKSKKEEIDHTDPHKCEWPENFYVELNGSLVQLTKKQKVSLPGRSNSFAYVGKNRPVDLSPYLRQGHNILKLVQTSCVCSYGFSIQIFARESQEFIEKKVSSHLLEEENSISLLKRLLSGKRIGADDNGAEEESDDDLEILQKNLRISLRCPISMTRIRFPVRGVECRHIECFDLQSYLEINRSTQLWKCPHCNKTTTSERLRVDAFLQRLLREAPENASDVELDADAQWTVVATVDSDSDNDDDDDDNVGGHGSSESVLKVPAAASASPKTTTARPIEVICLDSDDENTTSAPVASTAPVAGQKRPREETIDSGSFSESNSMSLGLALPGGTSMPSGRLSPPAIMRQRGSAEANTIPPSSPNPSIGSSIRASNGSDSLISPNQPSMPRSSIPPLTSAPMHAPQVQGEVAQTQVPFSNQLSSSLQPLHRLQNPPHHHQRTHQQLNRHKLGLQLSSFSVPQGSATISLPSSSLPSPVGTSFGAFSPGMLTPMSALSREMGNIFFDMSSTSSAGQPAASEVAQTQHRSSRSFSSHNHPFQPQPQPAFQSQVPTFQSRRNAAGGESMGPSPFASFAVPGSRDRMGPASQGLGVGAGISPFLSRGGSASSNFSASTGAVSDVNPVSTSGALQEVTPPASEHVNSPPQSHPVPGSAPTGSVTLPTESAHTRHMDAIDGGDGTMACESTEQDSGRANDREEGEMVEDDEEQEEDEEEEEFLEEMCSGNVRVEV
ncbi:uncharacterized protein VTP21DRAFT_5386 [Calcarisporiella thermophila]|uniref:uncharacterized protein n=1 Tax=Calcarisporiella thermophila TaxID=911321 RepID=UPI0037438AF0